MVGVAVSTAAVAAVASSYSYTSRRLSLLLAHLPKSQNQKPLFKKNHKTKPWTGDHSARPSMKSAASREN